MGPSNQSRQRGTLHPFLIQLHTHFMAGSAMAAWGALARMGSAQSADLIKTSLARAHDFYQGVKRFNAFAQTLTSPKKPCLWASPLARVYGDVPKAPAHSTCVWMPSLLNTPHIFDLDPSHSLAGFLKARGVESLFVEWQEPKGQGVSLSDYATCARDILAFAQKSVPGAVYGGGFCMGGLLAMGGASQLDKPLAGTVLFATPWDFRESTLPFVKGFRMPFSSGQTHVPSWALQLPFHFLEPRAIQRKYQALGKSDGNIDPLFARLESWLCDLRPLQCTLVDACLETFYGKNTPFQTGDIMGVRLRNETLGKVFMVTPTQDRIVPFGSSQPLANLLSASVLSPAMGHVGAFASKRAPDLIWEPLSAWFQRSSLR